LEAGRKQRGGRNLSGEEAASTKGRFTQGWGWLGNPRGAGGTRAVIRMVGRGGKEVIGNASVRALFPPRFCFFC
jgi:hypothetical protein